MDIYRSIVIYIYCEYVCLIVLDQTREDKSLSSVDFSLMIVPQIHGLS